MKQVHPDAIASLDLGEDLERAANITARRLNRAYEMLMREKAQAPRKRRRHETCGMAQPGQLALTQGCDFRSPTYG